MKYLVVGDTHGDIVFWRAVVETARDLGAEEIFQLGDFGFWPHVVGGRKFLVRLEELLTSHDLDTYWIDGNHENHAELRAIFRPYDGGPHPVKITEHIIHLPRGCLIEREGIRILACGGAHSVDRGHRVAGESWWPDETIDMKDVGRCKSAGRADIVLAHDAPYGAEVRVRCFHKPYELGRVVETDINRNRLRHIVDNARANLVFSGHWHAFSDSTFEAPHGPVRSVILDCNTGGEPNMAVLHLPFMIVDPVQC